MFRTAYNNCAKCTIAEEEARPSHSEAGPIPAFRVAHLTAVQKNQPLQLFDATMLDLFGPYTVFAGNLSLVEKLKLTRASKGLYPLINSQKVWVVIFLDLTYSCIDLQVAESCHASSIFQSIERFIAKRGAPLTLYSDLAASLVAIKKRLKEMEDDDQKDENAELFSPEEYSSLFSPEALTEELENVAQQIEQVVETYFLQYLTGSAALHSQNQGPVERKIKEVKRFLKELYRFKKLTTLEFQTLLDRLADFYHSLPVIADLANPGHFLSRKQLLLSPGKNTEVHISIPERKNNKSNVWTERFQVHKKYLTFAASIIFQKFGLKLLLTDVRNHTENPWSQNSIVRCPDLVKVGNKKQPAFHGLCIVNKALVSDIDQVQGRNYEIIFKRANDRHYRSLVRHSSSLNLVYDASSPHNNGINFFDCLQQAAIFQEAQSQSKNGVIFPPARTATPSPAAAESTIGNEPILAEDQPAATAAPAGVEDSIQAAEPQSEPRPATIPEASFTPVWKPDEQKTEQPSEIVGTNNTRRQPAQSGGGKVEDDDGESVLPNTATDYGQAVDDDAQGESAAEGESAGERDSPASREDGQNEPVGQTEEVDFGYGKNASLDHKNGEQSTTNSGQDSSFRKQEDKTEVENTDTSDTGDTVEPQPRRQPHAIKVTVESKVPQIRDILTKAQKKRYAKQQRDFLGQLGRSGSSSQTTTEEQTDQVRNSTIELQSICQSQPYSSGAAAYHGQPQSFHTSLQGPDTSGYSRASGEQEADKSGGTVNSPKTARKISITLRHGTTSAEGAGGSNLTPKFYRGNETIIPFPGRPSREPAETLINNNSFVIQIEDDDHIMEDDNHMIHDNKNDDHHNDNQPNDDIVQNVRFRCYVCDKMIDSKNNTHVSDCLRQFQTAHAQLENPCDKFQKKSKKNKNKNKNYSTKSVCKNKMPSKTIFEESYHSLCHELMHRSTPGVSFIIKLLVICALIKFCAAEHYCPPSSDGDEVGQALVEYSQLHQNIQYLQIRRAPRLGEKVAIIVREYNDSTSYSQVEWVCSRLGAGFTTLRFNHDEVYLLQKFSQKWKLNYSLLIFARMEPRRITWPNGDFVRFFDSSQVEFATTCPAEKDNFPGVILLTFNPAEKVKFRQVCDNIQSNSPRPATLCMQDDSTGIYGRKIRLHEQMVDEILTFRSDTTNQNLYQENVFKLENLKNLVSNNTAKYDGCLANKIQLFNHTSRVLLSNNTFPNISLVSKVTFENIKENYKHWKSIQLQLQTMSSQIQNAVEQSKIENYYDYKTRTVAEFFSKKYFQELYNGNLANIFSFTFLILCALIIIVTAIAIYKCCFKGFVAKLRAIFCPFFIFSCCTTLSKCCTNWCQPTRTQVIYMQAPVRPNPSFQARPSRRNQLMLQDNIYEDLFEEIT